MTGTPPVRRRLLGSALREYRENLGYEPGRGRPHPGVRPFEDQPDRDRPARHPRRRSCANCSPSTACPTASRPRCSPSRIAAGESGWWLDYRDVLSDDGQDYVIMEIAATRDPGLRGQPGSRPAADAGVRACRGRRRRPLRQRRAAGARRRGEADRQRTWCSPSARRGSTSWSPRGRCGRRSAAPPVMREQLAGCGSPDRVRDGADVRRRRRRCLSLRVLPFAAGAHAAAGCGSMTVAAVRRDAGDRRHPPGRAVRRGQPGRPARRSPATSGLSPSFARRR